MKKFILLFTCLIFVYSVASAAENTAFQKYKKPAEQGNPTAQFMLGTMYSKGDGVLKDPKKAFYWFKKSAEQGDPAAQYNLGLMYGRGDGVANDPTQAKYWINKAYESNDSKVSKQAKLVLDILKR